MNDNDKSFSEAVRLVQKQSPAPPATLEQSIAIVARTMGIYRRDLIAQGFSSDESMVLLLDWQKTMLAHVKV